MNRRRVIAAALVMLVALAAGCGDDDTVFTTAPASTTAASAATTQATTTTTTQATTTTAEATTTTASDLHPVWGVSWAAVWPADGDTASYRVRLWNGDTIDLPARVDYGVEWQGGTWDRITIGTTEPNEYGLALYFDRTEPWVIRIWGLQSTGPDSGPYGAYVEYPEEPQVLDLSGMPDSAPVLETAVLIDNGGGVLGPLPAVYTLSVVGLETIEVPAGTIEDALHLSLGLGGEFFGGTAGSTEVSNFWIQPGQLLVRWDQPAPGFGPFELLTLWE